MDYQPNVALRNAFRERLRAAISNRYNHGVSLLDAVKLELPGLGLDSMALHRDLPAFVTNRLQQWGYGYAVLKIQKWETVGDVLDTAWSAICQH